MKVFKKFVKWLNTPFQQFSDYKIGMKVKVKSGYFKDEIGKILDVQEYEKTGFSTHKPNAFYIQFKKTSKWINWNDLELLNWKPNKK